MLSKQAMMNVPSLRIQVIKNYICVTWMTGRKNDNLKIFWQSGQYFLSKGSHVDSNLNDFPCGKVHLNFEIAGNIYILVAMDQSFIQVKNDCLFILIPFGLRQVNFHMLDNFLMRRFVVMKHSEVFNWRQKMLACQWFLLLIRPENLTDIINRMPRRIWVLRESVQILMLGHLRNKLFDRGLRATARWPVLVSENSSWPFRFFHFHKNQFLLAFFVQNHFHRAYLVQ